MVARLCRLVAKLNFLEFLLVFLVSWESSGPKKASAWPNSITCMVPCKKLTDALKAETDYKITQTIRRKDAFFHGLVFEA